MLGRLCLPRLSLALCFALPFWVLHLSAPNGAEAGDIRLKIKVPPVGLPALGEFQASVLLDAAVDGVQAWSFGVAHDETVLELLEAGAGAATLTANGGGEPEFHVLDTDTANGAGLTQAVVLNLEDRSIVLPAGDDQELVTMRYGILVDPAETDPCDDVVTTLRFSSELSNELGSPPVKTAVTLGAESVLVETIDGTVAVSCPDSIITTDCVAKDEDVFLEWVFSPTVPTEELDFLFLYRDGDLLETLDVGARSHVDVEVSAGVHEYTIITAYFNESGSLHPVFGYCAVTVAPVTITSVEPAIGNWLGGDTITVRGTEFTAARTSSLVFYADGEDALPLEIVEVVGTTTLTALTPEAPRLGIYDLRLENEKGSAELQDAFEVGFVRGDPNADRATDISDVVFILDYLFLGGGEAPRCMDAGDVDDSGSIDVSDAVAMLDVLFRGGDPIPPPFEQPGQDPSGDEDGLGCLE